MQAGENAPLPGVMLPPSAPAQPSSGGCSGTAHDEHEAGAGPSTGRRSPSRKRKKSEGEDPSLLCVPRTNMMLLGTTVASSNGPVAQGEDDVDDASADGAPRRPMTRARKARHCTSALTT